MPYLVDGDNLLGTWRGRERTDRQRRELALTLGRLAARERKRYLTVFDGARPRGAAFGAGVRFAGRRSADDVILDILREQDDPRGWVVVTSDRPLGDRCRHLGATIMRCDVFRPRLYGVDAGPGSGEKPEHEPDVEGWLEVFGDDDSPD